MGFFSKKPIQGIGTIGNNKLNINNKLNNSKGDWNESDLFLLNSLVDKAEKVVNGEDPDHEITFTLDEIDTLKDKYDSEHYGSFFSRSPKNNDSIKKQSQDSRTIAEKLYMEDVKKPSQSGFTQFISKIKGLFGR